MTAIVFDIGNVLIRWDPVQAFLPALGSESAVRDFMARIDFDARNSRADGGARFADLAAELDDPADRETLGLYLSNFGASIVSSIEGSWVLLDRLRQKGHPIHAITNWSAETWHEGVRTHPRLGRAFATTIVSGEERIQKPDPAIFRLFCARADVRSDDCLFIDDRAENCEGAASVGMATELFTTPEALEPRLIARGLL